MFVDISAVLCLWNRHRGHTCLPCMHRFQPFAEWTSLGRTTSKCVLLTCACVQKRSTALTHLVASWEVHGCLPIMYPIACLQVYGNIVYETAARSGGMFVAGLAIDPLAQLLFAVVYKGISGKRCVHGTQCVRGCRCESRQ